MTQANRRPDDHSGGCSMEAAVLAAHRPGAVVEAGERHRVESHLEGCPACRRTARTSSALAVLAAEGPGFELPDPRRLYWRARVLDRLAGSGEAAERATRPVRWAWWVAGALAALVASLGLTRVAGELLEGLAEGAVVGLERVGSGVAGPLAGMTGMDPAMVQVAVWLGLALLAGASLLAAHSVLEEGL